MCNLPAALIKKDERQYKILYIDETLKNTKKKTTVPMTMVTMM